MKKLYGELDETGKPINAPTGITWKDVNNTQIWMVIIQHEGLWAFEKWNSKYPEHKILYYRFRNYTKAVNFMHRFVLGYF